MSRDVGLAQDVTHARMMLKLAGVEVPSWLSERVSNADAHTHARRVRALLNRQAVLDTIRIEAARNHVGTTTKIEPVVPNVPLAHAHGDRDVTVCTGCGCLPSDR